MTDQLLNSIPHRWLSVTQLVQYAPAMGRKKILRHIQSGDFVAHLDCGEWIIDRFSVDKYFSQTSEKREMKIKQILNKVGC